jgi:LicD family
MELLTHENLQILPWDSDLDLQVSEETIYFLAKYYNMTEYHFRLPAVSAGRNYLLEINPHYTNGQTDDKSNVIDARWIDTETGLFIDISTVRKNWTAIADGVEGALMCKDRHHYLVSRNPNLPPFDLYNTLTNITAIISSWCSHRKETSTHCAPASSKASPSTSPLHTPGSSRRNTAVRL